MPDVTGRDAILGTTRTDLPLHQFKGANTFIPAVLPFHPAFGSEVDAAALQDGIAASTDNLRKAATVSGTIAGGTLTVRVTNETGHKLPTGYPEGRRMWLHVRALDAKRTVVFESGRYVFSTATLVGYRAAPADPDYDPHLRIWEAEQGMSPDVATAVGLPAGRSFHLSLNNVRLKDTRIPPRGFTNAAFAAIDAEPVGGTYADGQYWDEVAYPVGAGAVRAEVTLYYQTASREYVEFLRDRTPPTPRATSSSRSTTITGARSPWRCPSWSSTPTRRQGHPCRAEGARRLRARRGAGRRVGQLPRRPGVHARGPGLAHRRAGEPLHGHDGDARVSVRARRRPRLPRHGGHADRHGPGGDRLRAELTGGRG